MNERLDKIATRNAGAVSPARRTRRARTARAYLTASGQAFELTLAVPPRGPLAPAEQSQAAGSHFVIDSCLWPFDAGNRLKLLRKTAANQAAWRKTA